MPYILSGTFPVNPADPAGSFENFVNAYFESMSGFTTTGATVLETPPSDPYYPDTYGYSLILWRAETQWLGGMGIIVLSVVFLSRILSGAILLLRAEAGPTETRLRPKITATFAILRWIYVGITIIEIIALRLAGMRWYDAVCHSFTVIASGGFSPHFNSISGYPNGAIQILLTIFMFMAGVNFVLYYHAITGRPKKLFKDPEFQAYSGIMALGLTLIVLNLVLSGGYPVEQAVREGIFNGVSIMSTTGYANANFDAWPDTARIILVIFMFIGGSAGSTAGAIKVIRILVLFKTVKREILRLLHPRAVIPIRLGGQTVPEHIVSGLSVFFFIYLAIALISTIALTFFGLDIVSALSGVATTMGGVGPGLGIIGPTQTYLGLSIPAKIWLSGCMWFGRLEIYAALILFFPSTYKS
jgi:trk system potassium uptake protein TrkH